MLTDDERKELVSAVSAWASRTPDAPVLGFIDGEGFCSAIELVREMEERTDTGEAFLEMLEHGVRREGLEKVVSRFYMAAARANA